MPGLLDLDSSDDGASDDMEVEDTAMAGDELTAGNSTSESPAHLNLLPMAGNGEDEQEMAGLVRITVESDTSESLVDPNLPQDTLSDLPQHGPTQSFTTSGLVEPDTQRNDLKREADDPESDVSESDVSESHVPKSKVPVYFRKVLIIENPRHEEMVTKFKAERDVLKEKLAERERLEEKLKTKENEYVELQGMHDNIAAKITTLESERDEAIQAKATAEVEAARLRNTSTEQHNQMDDAEKEMSEVHQHVEHALETLHLLRDMPSGARPPQMASRLKDGVKELVDRFANQALTGQKIKEGNETMSRDIEQKYQEITAAQRDKTKLEEQLKEAREEIFELTNTAEANQITSQKMKVELRTATEEISKYRTALQTANHNHQEVTEKIKKAEQDNLGLSRVAETETREIEEKLRIADQKLKKAKQDNLGLSQAAETEIREIKEKLRIADQKLQKAEQDNINLSQAAEIEIKRIKEKLLISDKILSDVEHNKEASHINISDEVKAYKERSEQLEQQVAQLNAKLDELQEPTGNDGHEADDEDNMDIDNEIRSHRSYSEERERYSSQPPRTPGNKTSLRNRLGLIKEEPVCEYPNRLSRGTHGSSQASESSSFDSTRSRSTTPRARTAPPSGVHSSDDGNHGLPTPASIPKRARYGSRVIPPPEFNVNHRASYQTPSRHSSPRTPSTTPDPDHIATPQPSQREHESSGDESTHRGRDQSTPPPGVPADGVQELLREFMQLRGEIHDMRDAKSGVRQKTKSSHYPFKLQERPRTRAPGRNEMMNIARNRFHKFLGIMKDDDIKTVASLVVADPDDIDAYMDGTLKIEALMDPIQIYFESPRHPYNVNLSHLFASEVLREYPRLAREDVEEHFLARIDVLRKNLEKQCARPGETIADVHARLQRTRKRTATAKRSRTRQEQLFNVRIDTCQDGDRQDDPKWRKLLTMTHILGVDGQSSDESDVDHGQRIFRVRRQFWRSREVSDLLRYIDAKRNVATVMGNLRPGAAPRQRKRIRADSHRTSQQIAARMPINLYNNDWYNSLESVTKVKLAVKNAMALYELADAEADLINAI
ncbi:hypothetical protein DXG01_010727 [Tephrocybe rancida]|nr:hypothetical protein DXG01_010727 [Tephrocybe rancida]